MLSLSLSAKRYECLFVALQLFLALGSRGRNALRGHATTVAVFRPWMMLETRRRVFCEQFGKHQSTGALRIIVSILYLFIATLHFWDVTGLDFPD